MAEPPGDAPLIRAALAENKENRRASHLLVLLNTEFLLTSRELSCNLAQGSTL